MEGNCRQARLIRVLLMRSRMWRTGSAFRADSARHAGREPVLTVLGCAVAKPFDAEKVDIRGDRLPKPLPMRSLMIIHPRIDCGVPEDTEYGM